MTRNTSSRRLDRYELLAEIARGGMGMVLLARLGGAGGFHRLFAIKVMHPRLVDDPRFVDMLLDEARVAARIHHPNVVATVDVRRHDDFHFIVMDYVEGFPLTRILDGAPFNRRQRIRIVNRMLIDVMSGLDVAHNMNGDDGSPLGIVHRDVSPQNVLVGADGAGRLTDFGIALVASRITASRSDGIKGKASYLAPEQASASEVDRRADLWALGVILWEGLTGVRLFSAESDAATVLKVMSGPIPSPEEYFPEVPPDLEALCMRALDRDPSRRHRSAREMAQELAHVAGRSGLLADTHEVADLIRDRLGDEMEGRRRAIQHYVSAIGGESPPATIHDLYNLPKLGEIGAPLGSNREPSRDPSRAVGTLTLPASRFLRGTPAGTAQDNPAPPRPRYKGMLGLLALFALGSVTTLTLWKYRVLDEIAPGLLPSTWTAAASEAPNAGEPETSVPVTTPLERKEASTSAPPAELPRPRPVNLQAARGVVTRPNLRAASEELATVATPEAPRSVARQAAPSGAVSATPSSAPRSRKVVPAKPIVAEPGLPIEQNPYRLQ